LNSDFSWSCNVSTTSSGGTCSRSKSPAQKTPLSHLTHSRSSLLQTKRNPTHARVRLITAHALHVRRQLRVRVTPPPACVYVNNAQPHISISVHLCSLKDNKGAEDFVVWLDALLGRPSHELQLVCNALLTQTLSCLQLNSSILDWLQLNLADIISNTPPQSKS
jgi:hypothetical protein